ncbi:MAG: protoporphyrinogen oxidase [Polyangiaceae bacterium]|nr:protoporphyrinogen oxidase [Polyangiaceae bacterium]
MTSRHIAVLGGGITGLTVAYRLLSSDKREGLSVTLIEAKPRLGGNIITERRDGFVVDGGPDSFVAAKPQATALCKELGLGSRLITTTEKNRRVYLLRHDKLHSLPEGLVLTIPTRFLPFATSPIFSWRGKARMGLDLALPRRPNTQGDESVGSFVRRRLGQEAVDVLADPLLGGIYAGDIEKLGIRSTFPQLAELEDKHGSLIRGALAQRRKAVRGAPPPSPFHSLEGGMGELVDALEASIRKAGGNIIVGAPIISMAPPSERSSGRWTLRFRSSDGAEESLIVDGVVMTTPAHVAASVCEPFDAELGDMLRGIPYLSTATVALAYPRSAVPHPLDAVGIIIPKDERRRILAATFISSKWKARAPEGSVLLRVFVGGHRDPSRLASTDDELASLAREELGRLLGVQAEPLFTRVFRYDQANAQPIVGHADHVQRIRQRAERHPGLWFAGAAFDGVGIPDCVRQANDAAELVLRSKI